MLGVPRESICNSGSCRGFSCGLPWAVAAYLVFGLMSYYRTWTWIAPLLLGVSLAIAQRRSKGRLARLAICP